MSYDNYKLSNPHDDGHYGDEVSSCCGAEYTKEHDKELDDWFYYCIDCGDDCNIIEQHEYAEKMTYYFNDLKNDW